MVSEEFKSPGQCKLCKKVVNKAQMARHLKACIEKSGKGKGKSFQLFRLVIECPYMPMYWLHVEIPGSKTLADLDIFLRHIWLECCGHMSGFTINGARYTSSPMEDSPFGPREKTMKQKICNVLSAGTKFKHEYDYGSTTDLNLRVLDVYERQVGKPGVILLARNLPPPWVCASCGKPATQIQAVGWGLEEESLFCEDCIDDEDEECVLPLVNSPRTGVCAYCECTENLFS